MLFRSRAGFSVYSGKQNLKGAVSRWLLLVENGNLCGAVPTGAR